ncbi:MAG: vWA domain-containing protein, partial [Myxococcota bacterium]
GCALVSTLIVALPAAAAPAAQASATTPVRVQIQEPRPGTPVRNRVDQARIRGNAVAEGERPLDIDVMIVVDMSGSTKAPSGVDIDDDGNIGFDPRLELVAPGTYPPDMKNTDPDDSILAAEIKAASALLENLDPTRVRVGVVSFSGMADKNGFRVSPDQQDAWLESPLTNDFEVAQRALNELLARGPHGGTDFGAGVNLAVRELAGLFGAKSSARTDTKKIVMFLTDGNPTFPVKTMTISEPGDIDFALNAARVAHQAQVTINVYAIGEAALRNPLAATEMARITLGSYLPVQNPGDVITYLQNASFANVDDVIFTNLTTSEVSEDVRLSPDGSFSGFVPVREGTNRVRVTALASDGSTGAVEFDLEFEKAGLSGRELAIELERIRKRNRALGLLIESERIKRFRAQARKGLEIRVEE